jgi:hypothetical protein
LDYGHINTISKSPYSSRGISTVKNVILQKVMLPKKRRSTEKRHSTKERFQHVFPAKEQT